MSTHYVQLPEDLIAELRAKAAEQGKTVDQLAEETLRKGLEERSWQELLAYGAERGMRPDTPKLMFPGS
jgi:plasmid stability protein